MGRRAGKAVPGGHGEADFDPGRDETLVVDPARNASEKGRSGRSCGSLGTILGGKSPLTGRFSFAVERAGVAQRSERPGSRSLSVAEAIDQGSDGKKSLHFGSSLRSAAT